MTDEGRDNKMTHPLAVHCACAKKDLGWLNAGGEIRKVIEAVVTACAVQGHQPRSVDEGSYGTVHVITCDDCGYVYRVDSGD